MKFCIAPLFCLIIINLWGAEDHTQVNQSLEWPGLDERSSLDSDDEVPSSYFNFDGNYDFINKSHFTTPEDLDQKIGYQQGDLDFNFTRMFDEGEGASIGLGYTYSQLCWDENPFFQERNFSNINLLLNAFTKRFFRWEWRGGLSASFDTREFANCDYNLYNLTLWGRYETRYASRMGVHLGFVGRSGIRQDKIIPILGLDFKMTHCWKLNLIYPVNMSAIYTITPCWSLAFSGKIWNTRHRVGKNETLSRGIFEYRNAGAEMSLNYDFYKVGTANIHVGSTLGGGDLKIADRNNRVIRHNKFNAAVYVGSSFSFKF